MRTHGRFILISLVVMIMVPAMTVLVGANNGTDSPCPDFFFQDPLPIDDWPVLASADSNTAWAVSLGGLIIKTTDGGANWEYQWSELQRDPDTPPFRGISVVDSNVAWICGDGGAVLVTSDGGGTWSDKSISVASQDFRLLGISALSSSVAWVVGQGGSVYRTADGGDSWASVPVAGVQDLAGVCALSDQNAWVSGDMNVVAYTTDGGTNWTRVDPAVGRVSTIQRIKAFDMNDVYAIGNSGSFFSTANGGGAWNFTDLGSQIYLFGMSFTDKKNGWLSGTDNYGAGYMAVTSDGGQIWTPVLPPQLAGERNVPSIDTAGASTVWSCTVDGGLLRSANGGGLWDRSDTAWTRAALTSVSAIDARSAWIVGASGTILRTFNGGRTWVTQQSHTPSQLFDIDAVSSSTAWAVGEDGTIMKTTDYGTTWTQQPSGTNARLARVAAVSGSEAWTCGNTETEGVVLQTDNGGSTWTPVMELAGIPVFAVAALDADRIWFGVIENKVGYIYRSVDGGQSWEKNVLPKPVPIQQVSDILDIRPVDKDIVLALVETAVGSDSFVYLYKSTDGGGSWNPVDGVIMADGDLFRLATVDGENIWSAGAQTVPYLEPTTVFHTGDGGANWEHGKNFHRTVLFGIDTVDGKVTWTAGYISTIQRSTCPSLFSISPHTAPNIGTARITDMAGSMFWEGMEVWLQKDGTRIDATNVDVVSPYKATCEFDLNGAEVGTYDVVTRNCSGLESTLPEGFMVTSPTTWYLPEGSTGGDSSGAFETWVLVENPNDADTNVNITYMTQFGEVAGPQLTMGGQSRLTVNVADTVPDEWSVSTRVTADAPIVAERAMYWNSGGAYRQCSHGSIGLSHLSRDWYLAEGSTGMDARGSFETWVLVQNPGSEKAKVEITYMTPDGAVKGPALELDPGRRVTFNVADTVPNEWSVSASVQSDVPIAAERSTYWNGGTYRQAANDSIGTSAPSREWYLAEGSTGTKDSGSLETWILLANPYEQTVKARLFYQIPSGQVEGPEVIIEPLTRETVNVADTVPGEFHVSTRVEADGPIVAERAMYWNTATYRQAAHASIGVMAPRNEWLVAEGSTGGDARGFFETWILVQNPNDQVANVKLTYMTPGGPVEGPGLEMAPNSRRSVAVADTLPGNWSVSTEVLSDVPVVVERALYWNAVTQPWRSAQSSKGYPTN